MKDVFRVENSPSLSARNERGESRREGQTKCRHLLSPRPLLRFAEEREKLSHVALATPTGD